MSPSLPEHAEVVVWAKEVFSGLTDMEIVVLRIEEEYGIPEKVGAVVTEVWFVEGWGVLNSKTGGLSIELVHEVVEVVCMATELKDAKTPQLKLKLEIGLENSELINERLGEMTMSVLELVARGLE